MYYIVQKRNNTVMHALFETQERAEEFLLNTVPSYCAKGYYMDRSLRPCDFEVIKRN